ncbi:MAG TPA: HWE histidine kinase domain-containing protein [Acetobacteraceae bacterium]|nr:HWE histidine kinase domain-containing protein [Acetobacteraceae bacterium]
MSPLPQAAATFHKPAPPAAAVVREPLRLLLLAGSAREAELLLAPLRAEQPDLVASHAATRETFAHALDRDGYDVILSEYGLPGLDGLQALATALRSAPQTPFIFVSGMRGEEIVIESLRHGATDYVLRHRLERLPAVVARAVAEARERGRRRQADERLRLLMGELSHRVKNTLASVLSIARQSIHGAASLDEFEDVFIGRMMALSEAHGLLFQSNWTGAALCDVVGRTLAPFRRDIGGGQIGGQEIDGRIDAAGPPVRLTPKMALALGMMVHELAINAVKHGALRVAEGHVEIAWSSVAEPEDEGARVELRWTERGGPPVAPPARHGFGTKLIERGVVYELDGAVSLDFAPEGFSCRIDFPLPHQWPAAITLV